MKPRLPSAALVAAALAVACGGRHHIESAPEHTSEAEQAALFASATAAQVASAVGSDGGVVDYNSTLAIMQAGHMPTEENP